MMSDLLNKGQIRDLAKAHQNGSDMLFKITQKQVGNGIGSIIASIAIPMILDAFRGKGVGRGGPQIGEASGGGGVQELDHQWLHLLLLAHGGEAEVKKKDLRKRSYQARRPVFKKTVPMINFDLLEWCQY